MVVEEGMVLAAAGGGGDSKYTYDISIVRIERVLSSGGREKKDFSIVIFIHHVCWLFVSLFRSMKSKNTVETSTRHSAFKNCDLSEDFEF
jgi:hypothetical protein